MSQEFNSLVPGRDLECNFENTIFNLVLLTGIFRFYDKVIRQMPQDQTYDKSTLDQVIALCRRDICADIVPLYNAIQCNMASHTSLPWLRQNINECFNPQKAPHMSP